MTNPTTEAIEALVKRLHALLDADADTKIFDIRRTDLVVMLTALAQRQRVKPLVWVSDGRHSFFGNGLFSYQVKETLSGCGWRWCRFNSGSWYASADDEPYTEEAAKAAAQADYEARILSALEPDPTGGWCSDMEAAKEEMSVLLYIPSKRIRPVREGFWVKPDNFWAWYGYSGKREAREHQPIAWRHLPTPPVRGQEKGGA